MADGNESDESISYESWLHITKKKSDKRQNQVKIFPSLSINISLPKNKKKLYRL